ncbi:hypothetical protein [Polynucleobacter sp. AP-Ainpum-60-G11]|uniref:hypothetical protein n=1 Tax=Polynucleobacter sp. AP-Ainpum-60-G11 TaxID=2576926 RepID=UPI001BFDB326|nr:hypothetical protein [Polynucleobacter sp. AP-Ainpum-60-G11]QWE27109.1 hypothetical protein FD971_02135 [Polynucleobacter sp. AP-Ainpum-60-G11]
MTDYIPPSEIHHLKEAQEDSSFRSKAPWYGLLAFIVLVVVSAIVHTYYFKDLPKCRDENIQILLNNNLRNNEQLLNNSQTLAFGQFQEKSHSAVQRDCSAELITNAGTYLIQYRVINNAGEQNFFQRLFSSVDYSIALESVNPTK